MRKLVHLSDLHFGRVDAEVARALSGTIRALHPELVLVSGDLTQRARKHQFIAARRFLDALSVPWLAVPGNHDIPLFDLFSRFTDPYRNYRRYVAPELEPTLIDDEIAVIGLKTTRRLRHKAGTLDPTQLKHTARRLAELPQNALRIVVTHHPAHTLQATELLRAGADLLLSGHLHAGRVETSLRYFQFEHRASLLIEAGTATSTRLRGESNSFNLIGVQGKSVEVTVFRWERSRGEFVRGQTRDFELWNEGWRATGA